MIMNKKALAAVAICLAALTASAANNHPRVIEITNPEMKVFLPSKDLNTGKAIVVCPGGGYKFVSLDNEGYEWAPFFNDEGVAIAVVNYTLPAHDLTRPMGDIDKAFEVLRDSAQTWGIDPEKIGIMGSSAGGHLAATISTSPESGSHPAFQLLFYPVISLDKAITHKTTREQFLPEGAGDDIAARHSCENNVTKDTPPAFIVHCGDDTVVPIQNTLRYYDSLLKAGVPATLAIYPKGNHGFGYRKRFRHHDLLKSQISAWLKTL